MEKRKKILYITKIVILIFISMGFGFFLSRIINTNIEDPNLTEHIIDPDNIILSEYPEFELSTSSDDVLISIWHTFEFDNNYVLANRYFIVGSNLEMYEVGHSRYAPLVYIKVSDLSQEEITTLKTMLDNNPYILAYEQVDEVGNFSD